MEGFRRAGTLVCGTLTVPPHSVWDAHGTPLIDDNVTVVCYYTMY